MFVTCIIRNVTIDHESITLKSAVIGLNPVSDDKLPTIENIKSVPIYGANDIYFSPIVSFTRL